MDALSISVTCLVILVIVFFLLIPKLRYKLSVRDGIRSYFNSRYQLFVFAHSRFSKVREGKQVYERYRDFERRSTIRTISTKSSPSTRTIRPVSILVSSPT